MKREKIEDATICAERFLELVAQVRYEEWHEPANGPVLRGALRRASLDLTRALAEMRRRP